jgi:hypothetical protein
LIRKRGESEMAESEPTYVIVDDDVWTASGHAAKKRRSPRSKRRKRARRQVEKFPGMGNVLRMTDRASGMMRRIY